MRAEPDVLDHRSRLTVARNGKVRGGVPMNRGRGRKRFCPIGSVASARPPKADLQDVGYGWGADTHETDFATRRSSGGQLARVFVGVIRLCSN